MLASRKKFCTKGHLYTLESTAYLVSNHQRVCLICNDFNHCSQGHLLFGDNLLIRKSRPNGGVKCRECGRIDCLSRKRRKESFLSSDELKTLNRERNLEHFYGLTKDKYERMLKEQNYKCANLFCPHPEDTNLFVDHDHSCCENYNGYRRKTCGKCIRGLLCSECNFALGKVKDSEASLLGLVEYLKKWKKSTQEFMSEEMKIISKLKEKKDTLGFGVQNMDPMGIKNYSDIPVKVLPLDQTIFSLEKIKT